MTKEEYNHIYEEVWYVIFDGRKYPCRQIWFERGRQLVATSDLDMVIYGDGGWPSWEAQYLDEQILFYLDPEEITLPHREIVKILREYIY